MLLQSDCPGGSCGAATAWGVSFEGPGGGLRADSSSETYTGGAPREAAPCYEETAREGLQIDPKNSKFKMNQRVALLEIEYCRPELIFPLQLPCTLKNSCLTIHTPSHREGKAAPAGGAHYGAAAVVLLGEDSQPRQPPVWATGPLLRRELHFVP